MRPLLLLPLLVSLLWACQPPAKVPPEPEPSLGPAPDPVKVQRAQARFRYREGLKQLEAKRLDEALLAFEEGARLDPTWADPHRMISGVHLRQGARAPACAAMQRFVALDQTPEPLRAQTLEAVCTD